MMTTFVPCSRKYLVFVNPASGQGKGVDIMKKLIHQWNYGNRNDSKNMSITCTVVESMYPGFVRDYLSQYKSAIVEEYYTGVIGVGGDGIVYEIVNALKSVGLGLATMSVSEIPAGSGNGFFQSLAFQYHQENNVDTAARWIVSGSPQLVDTMYVENMNVHLRLGLAWGLISDLDLKTEWLRMLGSARFTLGAAYYILKKKLYKGRLIIQPELGGDKVTYAGKFAYVWACNCSHGARDVHVVPGAKVNDGYLHISFVLETDTCTVSRTDLIQIMLGMEKGTHVSHPLVHTVRAKSFTLFIESGTMTFDGESSSTNYVHVVLAPKSLQIMGPKQTSS